MLDNEVKTDKEKLGLAEDETLDNSKAGRGGGGSRARSSAAVAAAEGGPDKKRKGGRKRGYQGEEEGRPTHSILFHSNLHSFCSLKKVDGPDRAAFVCRRSSYPPTCSGQ